AAAARESEAAVAEPEGIRSEGASAPASPPAVAESAPAQAQAPAPAPAPAPRTRRLPAERLIGRAFSRVMTDIDRFVPAGSRGDDLRRARLTVAVCFATIGFAPVYAAVHLAYGNMLPALAIFFAALLARGIPPVLRRTRSCLVAGNLASSL